MFSNVGQKLESEPIIAHAQNHYKSLFFALTVPRSGNKASIEIGIHDTRDMDFKEAMYVSISSRSSSSRLKNSTPRPMPFLT